MDDDKLDPIDLRLFLPLRFNGEPLSDTWLYPWRPTPLAERQQFIDG